MGSGRKKDFKAPTEGLKHVIFVSSESNNNKNMFVENLKNLSQHIAISGSIKHDAPIVAYAVRTLTAPVFEEPENPEKDYEGG